MFARRLTLILAASAFSTSAACGKPSEREAADRAAEDAAAVAYAARSQAAEVERAAFARASRADTEEAYREYLKAWPDSPRASEVARKVAAYALHEALEKAQRGGDPAALAGLARLLESRRGPLGRAAKGSVEAPFEDELERLLDDRVARAWQDAVHSRKGDDLPTLRRLSSEYGELVERHASEGHRSRRMLGFINARLRAGDDLDAAHRAGTFAAIAAWLRLYEKKALDFGDAPLLWVADAEAEVRSRMAVYQEPEKPDLWDRVEALLYRLVESQKSEPECRDYLTVFPSDRRSDDVRGLLLDLPAWKQADAAGTVSAYAELLRNPATRSVAREWARQRWLRPLLDGLRLPLIPSGEGLGGRVNARGHLILDELSTVPLGGPVAIVDDVDTASRRRAELDVPTDHRAASAPEASVLLVRTEKYSDEVKYVWSLITPDASSKISGFTVTVTYFAIDLPRRALLGRFIVRALPPATTKQQVGPVLNDPYETEAEFLRSLRFR
jgi:hypothetical protein